MPEGPIRGRSRGCLLCGTRSPLISAALGVCAHCARSRPEEALRLARLAHGASRRDFSLPESPPRTPGGAACGLCARACVIGEGERGFCGLRLARNGRIVHLAGTPRRGLLSWYHDPLPTNCVADWVCAGHGRPGRHNLAVFYASCTLNCLFCQNWHFRRSSPEREAGIGAEDLARTAREQTFCACFFGGDPASQMPHALSAARSLAERNVTVCWETAGTSHPKFLDRAVAIALETGGCVKFDLKAFDETLHRMLTG